MVLPDSDWKNQSGDVLDATIAVLGLTLVCVSLYLWWTGPLVGYLVVAIAVIGGGVVYFAELWQPVLYLVIAVALLAFSGYVVAYGSWREPLELALLALNVTVAVLAVYLSYAEERRGADQRRQ